MFTTTLIARLEIAAAAAAAAAAAFVFRIFVRIVSDDAHRTSGITRPGGLCIE
jgi:hypothetical protein